LAARKRLGLHALAHPQTAGCMRTEEEEEEEEEETRMARVRARWGAGQAREARHEYPREAYRLVQGALHGRLQREGEGERERERGKRAAVRLYRRC
jgi:hypothetical protein